MDMGIAGKHALVTGGCAGIGKAVAVSLAREGANVVVTSRKQERIAQTVDELKSFGGEHYGILSDITLPNEPTRVVNEMLEKSGDINIVVNNVGSHMHKKDPLCSLEDWEKLFRLILGVAIEINNRVIPVMTEKKWGRIVNITAGASMENSGPVPYCALKAAYTAYSRSLARVLALEKTGIVMSAILPGVVFTKEGDWDTNLKERPEFVEKYLEERTVLKRLGQPEEISPMVCLLCSEHASFCIGSVIPVEGGQARHYFQKVDDY
jgi:3-oxoacyl-[acyl-carrier protein] reductase